MLDIWNYTENLSKFTCPVCGHVMNRETGELFSVFLARCRGHIKQFCSN